MWREAAGTCSMDKMQGAREECREHMCCRSADMMESELLRDPEGTAPSVMQPRLSHLV